MTTEQAIDRVARLKGLFSKMTQQEEDFWADRFERHDAAHIDTAIERYSEKRSGDIDRPALLELIRCEQSREIRSNYGRIRRLETETADNWDKISRFIADCSDDDLADLKAEAIRSNPKLTAATREMFEKMDPRKRKSLQVLIYEYFMKTARAR